MLRACGCACGRRYMQARSSGCITWYNRQSVDAGAASHLRNGGRWPGASPHAVKLPLSGASAQVPCSGRVSKHHRGAAVCESGRDVMGLPLRAPHCRSDPIFLEVPGALPAERRRGAMPSWGRRSFGRRWLGASVGERVFEEFILCLSASAGSAGAVGAGAFLSFWSGCTGLLEAGRGTVSLQRVSGGCRRRCTLRSGCLLTPLS